MAANTVSALLTTKCPPPPDNKCPCTVGEMDCSTTDHITLPLFSKPITLNRLRISNKPSLTISNNSFVGLTVSRLELTSNRLSKIEINAFNGLTVDDLDLSDNIFQKIPESVARIPNLKGLDISHNPISSFSNDHFDSTQTMKRLGSNLLRFSFGSQDMTEWPRELAFFPKLEELNVTSGSFNILSLDAFYGFDKSLRKLQFAHTNLRRNELTSVLKGDALMSQVSITVQNQRKCIHTFVIHLMFFTMYKF